MTIIRRGPSGPNVEIDTQIVRKWTPAVAAFVETVSGTTWTEVGSGNFEVVPTGFTPDNYLAGWLHCPVSGTTNFSSDNALVRVVAETPGGDVVLGYSPGNFTGNGPGGTGYATPLTVLFCKQISDEVTRIRVDARTSFGSGAFIIGANPHPDVPTNMVMFVVEEVFQ